MQHVLVTNYNINDLLLLLLLLLLGHASQILGPKLLSFFFIKFPGNILEHTADLSYFCRILFLSNVESLEDGKYISL
jgi:hypothetical protein